MIKAVIFDCFGVVLADALQQIRDELSAVDPVAAKDVTDIVAANNRGLISPRESSMQIADILGMDIHEYHTRIAQGETRNQRLLDSIKKLKSTYKTAMLSNIAGSSLARRFPNSELSIYFDEVVASADIGYMKPEREAYEIAASRLGVETGECVFVDDREIFCEAARAAGMQAVLYTNFTQFQSDLATVLTDTKH